MRQRYLLRPTLACNLLSCRGGLLQRLGLALFQTGAAGLGAACSGTCSRGSVGTATTLLPPLQQQRLVVTASAAGSQAEDFDLIAPDAETARIEGVDGTGFIVNGVQVEGSIMLCGDVFTLWRTQRFADITLDSLALLQLLRPVPDLLVLGCGHTVRQLPADIMQKLHEMGVRVDAMDTTNAVATFNVLNQEGRKVVGALLPVGMTNEG